MPKSSEETKTLDVVRTVFDKALQMQPGAKIPIKFSSEAHRESFRVRFYNERKRYAEKYGEILADTVQCTKLTTAGSFYLIIQKAEPMSLPYIVNPDGTTEAIDLEGVCYTEPTPFPQPPSCTPVSDLGSGTETEEERRLRLMREDGLYEE